MDFKKKQNWAYKIAIITVPSFKKVKMNKNIFFLETTKIFTVNKNDNRMSDTGFCDWLLMISILYTKKMSKTGN